MKQLDKHEKDGDVSEDEKKAYEDSIQELTDDYVKQIDKLVKGKQDELSKVWWPYLLLMLLCLQLIECVGITDCCHLKSDFDTESLKYNKLNCVW